MDEKNHMTSPAKADPVTVSATEPDWSREAPSRFWDPSRRLLKSLRRYQALRARGTPPARLLSRLVVLKYRFWSAVSQVDIPLNTMIGGGLVLPHPNGVVIHPTSKVGYNCVIFQQVTLGTARSRSGTPVIGGGVSLGAGSRILGPVTIGDHAVIGANAVVLQDIPAGAIAVGIPARIVGYRF